MNYAVCPCVLCNEPMTFRAVREGVFWLEEPENVFWMHWDGPIHRFAHRGCWRALSEGKRRSIRDSCYAYEVPRSMGSVQFASLHLV